MARLRAGSYGRLTADSRVLPSFLLCGGHRCGTAALAAALAAHPAVLAPAPRRALHYFDTGYDRGPRWYRAHFPTRRAAERIAWRYGVAPVTFESNPDYLYHPHAVARIARDLPGVRVIVLVRDPVQRAYAHHAQQVARGFEPERDFRRALALERFRLRGEYERMVADPDYQSLAHRHYGYRARGDYARHLARMATHLPRERILVLETADLIGSPEAVYARVLDFLHLPYLGRSAYLSQSALARPGPAQPVRRQPGLGRGMVLGQPGRGMRGPGVADLARSLGEVAIDERVCREMSAYFATRDAELEPWLGHTPSWRTPAAAAAAPAPAAPAAPAEQGAPVQAPATTGRPSSGPRTP